MAKNKINKPYIDLESGQQYILTDQIYANSSIEELAEQIYLRSEIGKLTSKSTGKETIRHRLNVSTLEGVVTNTMIDSAQAKSRIDAGDKIDDLRMIVDQDAVGRILNRSTGRVNLIKDSLLFGALADKMREISKVKLSDFEISAVISKNLGSIETKLFQRDVRELVEQVERQYANIVHTTGISDVNTKLEQSIQIAFNMQIGEKLLTGLQGELGEWFTLFKSTIDKYNKLVRRVETEGSLTEDYMFGKEGGLNKRQKQALESLIAKGHLRIGDNLSKKVEYNPFDILSRMKLFRGIYQTVQEQIQSKLDITPQNFKEILFSTVETLSEEVDQFGKPKIISNEAGIVFNPLQVKQILLSRVLKKAGIEAITAGTGGSTAGAFISTASDFMQSNIDVSKLSAAEIAYRNVFKSGLRQIESLTDEQRGVFAGTTPQSTEVLFHGVYTPQEAIDAILNPKRQNIRNSGGRRVKLKEALGNTRLRLFSFGFDVETPGNYGGTITHTDGTTSFVNMNKSVAEYLGITDGGELLQNRINIVGTDKFLNPALDAYGVGGNVSKERPATALIKGMGKDLSSIRKWDLLDFNETLDRITKAKDPTLIDIYKPDLPSSLETNILKGFVESIRLGRVEDATAVALRTTREQDNIRDARLALIKDTAASIKEFVTLSHRGDIVLALSSPASMKYVGIGGNIGYGTRSIAGVDIPEPVSIEVDTTRSTQVVQGYSLTNPEEKSGFQGSKDINQRSRALMLDAGPFSNYLESVAQALTSSDIRKQFDLMSNIDEWYKSKEGKRVQVEAQRKIQANPALLSSSDISQKMTYTIASNLKDQTYSRKNPYAARYLISRDNNKHFGSEYIGLDKSGIKEFLKENGKNSLIAVEGKPNQFEVHKDFKLVLQALPSLGAPGYRVLLSDDPNNTKQYIYLTQAGIELSDEAAKIASRDFDGDKSVIKIISKTRDSIEYAQMSTKEYRDQSNRIIEGIFGKSASATARFFNNVQDKLQTGTKSILNQLGAVFLLQKNLGLDVFAAFAAGTADKLKQRGASDKLTAFHVQGLESGSELTPRIDGTTTAMAFLQLFYNDNKKLEVFDYTNPLTNENVKIDIRKYYEGTNIGYDYLLGLAVELNQGSLDSIKHDAPVTKTLDTINKAMLSYVAKEFKYKEALQTATNLPHLTVDESRINTTGFLEEIRKENAKSTISDVLIERLMNSEENIQKYRKLLGFMQSTLEAKLKNINGSDKYEIMNKMLKTMYHYNQLAKVIEHTEKSDIVKKLKLEPEAFRKFFGGKGASPESGNNRPLSNMDGINDIFEGTSDARKYHAVVAATRMGLVPQYFSIGDVDYTMKRVVQRSGGIEFKWLSSFDSDDKQYSESEARAIRESSGDSVKMFSDLDVTNSINERRVAGQYAKLSEHYNAGIKAASNLEVYSDVVEKSFQKDARNIIIGKNISKTASIYTLKDSKPYSSIKVHIQDDKTGKVYFSNLSSSEQKSVVAGIDKPNSMFKRNDFNGVNPADNQIRLIVTASLPSTSEDFPTRVVSTSMTEGFKELRNKLLDRHFHDSFDKLKKEYDWRSWDKTEVRDFLDGFMNQQLGKLYNKQELQLKAYNDVETIKDKTKKQQEELRVLERVKDKNTKLFNKSIMNVWKNMLQFLSAKSGDNTFLTNKDREILAPIMKAYGGDDYRHLFKDDLEKVKDPPSHANGFTTVDEKLKVIYDTKKGTVSVRTGKSDKIGNVLMGVAQAEPFLKGMHDVIIGLEDSVLISHVDLYDKRKVLKEDDAINRIKKNVKNYLSAVVMYDRINKDIKATDFKINNPKELRRLLSISKAENQLNLVDITDSELLLEQNKLKTDSESLKQQSEQLKLIVDQQQSSPDFQNAYEVNKEALGKSAIARIDKIINQLNVEKLVDINITKTVMSMHSMANSVAHDKLTETISNELNIELAKAILFKTEFNADKVLHKVLTRDRPGNPVSIKTQLMIMLSSEVKSAKRAVEGLDVGVIGEMLIHTGDKKRQTYVNKGITVQVTRGLYGKFIHSNNIRTKDDAIQLISNLKLQNSIVVTTLKNKINNLQNETKTVKGVFTNTKSGQFNKLKSMVIDNMNTFLYAINRKRRFNNQKSVSLLELDESETHALNKQIVDLVSSVVRKPEEGKDTWFDKMPAVTTILRALDGKDVKGVDVNSSVKFKVIKELFGLTSGFKYNNKWQAGYNNTLKDVKVEDISIVATKAKLNSLARHITNSPKAVETKVAQGKKAKESADLITQPPDRTKFTGVDPPEPKVPSIAPILTDEVDTEDKVRTSKPETAVSDDSFEEDRNKANMEEDRKNAEAFVEERGNTEFVRGNPNTFAANYGISGRDKHTVDKRIEKQYRTKKQWDEYHARNAELLQNIDNLKEIDSTQVRTKRYEDANRDIDQTAQPIAEALKREQSTQDRSVVATAEQNKRAIDDVVERYRRKQYEIEHGNISKRIQQHNQDISRTIHGKEGTGAILTSLGIGLATSLGMVAIDSAGLGIQPISPELEGLKHSSSITTIRRLNSTDFRSGRAFFNPKSLGLIRKLIGADGSKVPSLLDMLHQRVLGGDKVAGDIIGNWVNKTRRSVGKLEEAAKQRKIDKIAYQAAIDPNNKWFQKQYIVAGMGIGAAGILISNSTTSDIDNSLIDIQLMQSAHSTPITVEFGSDSRDLESFGGSSLVQRSRQSFTDFGTGFLVSGAKLMSDGLMRLGENAYPLIQEYGMHSAFKMKQAYANIGKSGNLEQYLENTIPLNPDAIKNRLVLNESIVKNFDKGNSQLGFRGEVSWSNSKLLDIYSSPTKYNNPVVAPKVPSQLLKSNGFKSKYYKTPKPDMKIPVHEYHDLPSRDRVSLVHSPSRTTSMGESSGWLTPQGSALSTPLITKRPIQRPMHDDFGNRKVSMVDNYSVDPTDVNVITPELSPSVRSIKAIKPTLDLKDVNPTIPYESMNTKVIDSKRILMDPNRDSYLSYRMMKMPVTDKTFGHSRHMQRDMVF